MITYAQARAATGFLVSGVTDPAFDGSCNRYGPPNGPSASFHYSRWPDGAPHQAHFTVAARGRLMASGFERFHISVECDGINVGIPFNHNAVRGNLAKTIDRRCISPRIQEAFDDFYAVDTNRRSIDVMVLQGFSKISGALVTTVFHAGHRQSASCPGVATEVEEDRSLAFQQLFGR